MASMTDPAIDLEIPRQSHESWRRYGMLGSASIEPADVSFIKR